MANWGVAGEGGCVCIGREGKSEWVSRAREGAAVLLIPGPPKQSQWSANAVATVHFVHF